jgi:hypothetical protein
VAAGKLADGVSDRDAEREPDGKPADSRGRVVHARANRLHPAEKLAGVPQQRLARGGQPGTAGVPVKEPGFQVGFQCANLAGQDWLGDVQGIGGAAEVLQFCDRHEVPQLTRRTAGPLRGEGHLSGFGSAP